MDDAKLAGAKKEFRNDDRSNDTEEALRLMDHPDSTEEIPVVDMTPFLKGEAGGREKVAAQLKVVTETIGFFYLSGHGIAVALIDRMFAQSRRFHSLSEEVKQKVSYIRTDGFETGYHNFTVEQREQNNVNIITVTKPNLYSRYTYSWARPGAENDAINRWPENLPGFRETMLDYRAEIESLARKFMTLWATSLKLPEDYFDPYFQPSIHLLISLLHYPPQKEVGNRQYGISPHTDNSLMTFLLQGEVPGLAVRMPSGHWRKVENKPGTILINTGNVMVRWTNDQYLSTKHRVINTAGIERYSIPAFFGPSPDALIKCLPTCQSTQHPAQYEPISYRDLRKWYYSY